LAKFLHSMVIRSSDSCNFFYQKNCGVNLLANIIFTVWTIGHRSTFQKKNSIAIIFFFNLQYFFFSSRARGFFLQKSWPFFFSYIWSYRESISNLIDTCRYGESRTPYSSLSHRLYCVSQSLRKNDRASGEKRNGRLIHTREINLEKFSLKKKKIWIIPGIKWDTHSYFFFWKISVLGIFNIFNRWT